MKCKIATQLSIFLANKPGTLAEVCETLAGDQINIFAMTISDTVDHAVVRMVCSDPQKALAIFEERGTLVVDQQVITIEDKNCPGTLGQIARKMAAHKVNIEYAYCTATKNQEFGCLVIKTKDAEQTLEILEEI